MAYYSLVVSVLLLLTVVGVTEECLEGGLDINTVLLPPPQDMHFIVAGSQEQYIVVPELVMNCYGRITSWSALTVVRNPSKAEKDMHKITMTVWRPRQGNQYNLIGQNQLSFADEVVKEAMFSMDNSTGTIPPDVGFFVFTKKKPHTYISFQPGDVLGWSIPETGGLFDSPLSIVSRRKKVTPNGAPLERIQVMDGTLHAYCSYLYCDKNSEMVSVAPFISFEYELEKQKTGFYVAPNGDDCHITNQDCEIHFDAANREATWELDSYAEGITTNALFGIIAASLSVALILFTVFCTVNYIFFFIHSKKLKKGIVPIIDGILEPELESEPKPPAPVRDIEPLKSLEFRTDNDLKDMQEAKPYLKNLSHATTQSAPTNEKELRSSGLALGVPQVNGPRKSSPTTIKIEKMDFLKVSKVLEKGIVKHSAASFQPPLRSKGIPKTSSLPIVTNKDFATIFDKFGEIPINIIKESVPVADKDLDLLSPAHILRFGATGESLPNTAGAGIGEGDMIRSCTRFSGSIAGAIINQAASSRETAVVDESAEQDGEKRRIKKEEYKMEFEKIEVKIENVDAHASDDQLVKEKYSAFFDVVGPPRDFPITAVKPYYSSGAVPMHGVLLDSDVEMSSDHSLARKSI